MQPIPEIIGLSETWSNEANARDYAFQGYHHYFVNRPGGGRGGGVSLQISSSFKSSKVDNLSYCSDLIEICTVEMDLIEQDKIFLCCIYRPHSSTIDDFTDELIRILNSETLRSKKTILMGDFNVNLLSENTDVLNFITSLQSTSFIPTIDKPTHFSSHENVAPSLLDHIWTNYICTFSSGIIYAGISDHCPIFSKIPFSVKKSEKIFIKFRSISDFSLNVMKSSLQELNWDLVLTGNLNQKTENFIKKLDQIFVSSCPLKTKHISVKRLNSPWLTQGILKSIKIKSQMFKRVKNNQLSYDQFKIYRNILTQTIRSAKNNYFRHKFEQNRSNMRKVWLTIKDLLNQSKNHHEVRKLIVNNNILTETSDIANAFNNHFARVGTELNSQIPPCNIDPCSYIHQNQTNSFFLSPVSADEINNLLCSLKKSKSETCKMPTKIIASMSDMLCLPLSKLINESFFHSVYFLIF